MGGGAADERQRRVVPRPEPILDHGCHEMASLPIPDELMVEIFLRLLTPADLARASATCVSFRRVTTDRSFIRRYRKLHAPPLLGFLERRKVFHPASAPYPSASAASAVALAADFNFSFLPAPVSDWVVKDVRDGRVLLDRTPTQSEPWYCVFPEMVVCDPLHRRYVLLPPIPDNLAASVEDPLFMGQRRCCETFLAPSGNADDETTAAEETSFSVIWMAQCKTKLVAFVFSSSTGQWRTISSQSWSDLLPGSLSRAWLPVFSSCQYAYGCFYWVADWRRKLLVLDTRRMEFSIAEVPPGTMGGKDIAIVEAGEGRPGIFVRLEDIKYLKYYVRRNNCGSSSQWQLEKTVSLDFDYSEMYSAGRHLFLYQRKSKSCFSLDAKTFQLDRLFVSHSCIPYGHMHMYSNFPPSLLSTPSISSDVEKGTEEETLEQCCAASSSAVTTTAAVSSADGLVGGDKAED